MSKHTLGPWRAIPSTAGGGTRRMDIVSDGATPYAPAFVGSDIMDDDATLIAAAPDMYAALVAYVSAWEHPDAHTYHSALDAARQIAIAAIAKAEGE